MANIFALSVEYQRLMDAISDKEEITSEEMELLESISDSLENKVLAYASIIKSMEAQSLSITNAAEGMVTRAERLKKSAQRLREVVKTEMQHCDKEKVENDYHQIRLRLNNPKVHYVRPELIPHEYIRREIKEIESPNGILILRALKDNISIPGVELARDTRLEIR